MNIKRNVGVASNRLDSQYVRNAPLPQHYAIYTARLKKTQLQNYSFSAKSIYLWRQYQRLFSYIRNHKIHSAYNLICLQFCSEINRKLPGEVSVRDISFSWTNLRQPRSPDKRPPRLSRLRPIESLRTLAHWSRRCKSSRAYQGGIKRFIVQNCLNEILGKPLQFSWDDCQILQSKNLKATSNKH